MDYYADRFCPVLNQVISCDYCYEYNLVLHRFFKLSSVPELQEILQREDRIEEARIICQNCPYSDLS